MHLTLGVMPLRSEQDVERQGEGKTQLHIPSEALTHLHSLRAQIGECLQGEKLRLALGPVETFPSKRWKIRDPSHTAAKEMLSGEAEGMDDGEEDIDMDLSRDAGAAKGEGGKGLAYYKREMADVLFVSVPESDPRNARVWALGRPSTSCPLPALADQRGRNDRAVVQSRRVHHRNATFDGLSYSSFQCTLLRS